MTHPSDQELISAYLDGELSAAEEARVEKLLAAGGEARQLYDDLRALRASLESLPRHRAPGNLVERVLQRAEREMLSSKTGGALGNGELPPIAAADPAVDRRPSLSVESVRMRSWRPLVYAVVTVAAALLIVVYQGVRPLPERPIAKADKESLKETLEPGPTGGASIGAAPRKGGASDDFGSLSGRGNSLGRKSADLSDVPLGAAPAPLNSPTAVEGARNKAKVAGSDRSPAGSGKEDRGGELGNFRTGEFAPQSSASDVDAAIESPRTAMPVDETPPPSSTAGAAVPPPPARARGGAERPAAAKADRDVAASLRQRNEPAGVAGRLDPESLEAAAASREAITHEAGRGVGGAGGGYERFASGPDQRLIYVRCKLPPQGAEHSLEDLQLALSTAGIEWLDSAAASPREDRPLARSVEAGKDGSGVESVAKPAAPRALVPDAVYMETTGESANAVLAELETRGFQLQPLGAEKVQAGGGGGLPADRHSKLAADHLEFRQPDNRLTESTLQLKQDAARKPDEDDQPAQQPAGATAEAEQTAKQSGYAVMFSFGESWDEKESQDVRLRRADDAKRRVGAVRLQAQTDADRVADKRAEEKSVEESSANKAEGPIGKQAESGRVAQKKLNEEATRPTPRSATKLPRIQTEQAERRKSGAGKAGPASGQPPTVRIVLLLQPAGPAGNELAAPNAAPGEDAPAEPAAPQPDAPQPEANPSPPGAPPQ